MGKPPADLSTRGAFDELQGHSDYTGERCDLAPMDVSKLSIPGKGFKPICLQDLLQLSAPDFIHEVTSKLLLPKVDRDRRVEELGLERPYNDPSLRSRVRRAQLVSKLHHCNMVDDSLHDGTRVGFFCVHKSDKQSPRLIVDARVSNCMFKDPDTPDLPTGASFCRINVAPGCSIFESSSDLKDAFYTIELPTPLRLYFTLDPVKASDLGISILDGVSLERNTLVHPRLSVVPMGWSHAVYICQTVVRSLVLKAAGVRPSMLVSDLAPLPDLDSGAIFIYVDNIITVGTDKNLDVQLQKNINHVVESLVWLFMICTLEYKT